MSLIIGRKPVLEALRAGKSISKIYVAFGQKGKILAELGSLIKKSNLLLKEVNNSKLDSLTNNQNHQGVVAVLEEASLTTLSAIVKEIGNKKNPLLLLLDSIQDPHNLGAILRSAECAGVDGVILTQHNSATITETVSKTSAGAVSYLKICEVSNLNNAIKFLKDNGYWIVGSALEKKSVDYNTIDYNMPVGLIVGNEEKGIKRLVAENCDYLVKIPMSGNIQSLNVSVASGILLFNIVNLRK